MSQEISVCDRKKRDVVKNENISPHHDNFSLLVTYIQC